MGNSCNLLCEDQVISKQNMDKNVIDLETDNDINSSSTLGGDVELLSLISE